MTQGAFTWIPGWQSYRLIVALFAHRCYTSHKARITTVGKKGHYKAITLPTPETAYITIARLICHMNCYVSSI